MSNGMKVTVFNCVYLNVCMEKFILILILTIGNLMFLKQVLKANFLVLRT